MLTLADVSKSYGPRTLFGDVSLFIGREDRFGLVGPNGAGKTTLFNLILGVESAGHGRRSTGRRARASATCPRRRRPPATRRSSTWRPRSPPSSRSCATSSGPMETGGSPACMQAEFDDHHRFEELGGYAVETKAKIVLTGLGFRRRRLRQAGEDLLGRLGHARAPCAAPRPRAGAPPARRADEPPRPGGPALVPGLPHALPRRARHHLPRPGLPERALHGDPRAARRGRSTGGPATTTTSCARRRPTGSSSRRATRTSSARSPTCSGSSTASARRPRSPPAPSRRRSRSSGSKAVAIEAPEDDLRRIHSSSRSPRARGSRSSSSRACARPTATTSSTGTSTSTPSAAQRLVLVGPNGAGKSTLLKILAGVDPDPGGARASSAAT